MEFGLKSDEIEMVKSFFREIPEVEKVIIFGSRAMGNFKKGSDVDLALEGEINADILARVRSRLNEGLPLPYVFDIFALRGINNVDLQKHIKEYGKPLYSRMAA